jgi:hypothetical protein
MYVPRMRDKLVVVKIKDRRLTVATDTEDEKDKFFKDALFYATEMTSGQTFADHLPLMNFWAGFTASNEVCLPIAQLNHN